MNHRNFTEEEDEHILSLLGITGSLIALGILALTAGIIGNLQNEAYEVFLVLLGSTLLGFGVIFALVTIAFVIEAAARLVAEAVDGNEPEPELILPGDRAWPS